MEVEANNLANTSEDDEGEHVNIEFDDSDDKDHQSRDDIERQLNKVENYPSQSNSPSNSSEDGNSINGQINFGTKKPGRKTDRQRVESGARREWSDSEILSLIQLWRDNDILYNTNHPLYYVQTERKMAMDHISNDLRISVKDVNDKMHSLRTYYCSQRQRLGSLINSHGDSKQFSRWKFYDHMSFLYESVTNRAFKSSMSGKARKMKRELQRSDFAPYLNLHGGVDPHMNSHSPARMYETGYNTPPMYPENPPVLHERDDKDMTGGRLPPPLGDGGGVGLQPRRRSLDLNPAGDQTMDVKDQHLFSSSPPNMASALMAAGSISDMSKDLFLGGKLKGSDEMFGHMVATSLSLIDDEQQKELLKLNLQTMIYNVRFRKGLQQSTFPS